MATRQRRRTAVPARWEQLELLCTSPEQRTYERIRPVVLFGQPAAERARDTNTAARTVSRHAKQFGEQGMRSVMPPPPARLPPAIQAAIVALKVEHPSLYGREIATICFVRFGRRHY